MAEEKQFLTEWLGKTVIVTGKYGEKVDCVVKQVSDKLLFVKDKFGNKFAFSPDEVRLK